MSQQSLQPTQTILTQTQSAPSVSIAHSVLSLLPINLALEHFALPLKFDNRNRLEVLMAYPSDADTLQMLQMYFGMAIKPIEMKRDDLIKLIHSQYGTREKAQSATDIIKPPRSSRLSYNRAQDTTSIVNDIIHEAVRLRASDIHLEPFEREMCVRFRIDGVLQEIMSIPAEKIPETISRVKILAGMDIAERRRAQDGRIRVNELGKDVDIRASALPTDFGEKIVLRLLDKGAYDFGLESIGMDPTSLAIFKKAIQMPNGIVLLTGPTGSGKTTTLYAGLKFLKKPGVNISTVEDPIEYNVTGVNQTQVNQYTDMTFANCLRTLLRQDPDIIMVGEMRDKETAEIAVRASLTGHLVLSTLHTNDAPSAATRLVDMGVESYLVSSSITLVVAQRLVRKICEHCKCEDIEAEKYRITLGLPPGMVLHKGLGCSACGHTGYKGRIGIYEVMPISEDIRVLINKKAYASELRAQATKDGMTTLRDSALSLLASGTTSAEEVLREISMLV